MKKVAACDLEFTVKLLFKTLRFKTLQHNFNIFFPKSQTIQKIFIIGKYSRCLAMQGLVFIVKGFSWVMSVFPFRSDDKPELQGSRLSPSKFSQAK